MDVELVDKLLKSDSDVDLIRKDDMLAREMGIGGVPTFLIDQRFPINGAQEPDTILYFLNKAIEVREKEAAAKN